MFNPRPYVGSTKSIVGDRMICEDGILTPDGTAKTIATLRGSAIPSGVDSVVLQIQNTVDSDTKAVRAGMTSLPTTSSGQILPNGTQLILTTDSDLANYKFVKDAAATGTVTMHIQYLKK